MTCALLGTPSFAIPAAEILTGTSTCTLLGIITKPDEPVGRSHAMTPPPLAMWAREHGIRLLQPDTKDELTALLTELRPDVAVVVAYGKIIPSAALAIPKFGFVNIHPSLLPKYRGPSPVHAAIANGDAETGVTLMLLDAEVDHGPLLAQERVEIPPAVTRSELDAFLAERGAQLLARTLPKYLAGRTAPQPQDHARATMTPLLTREHGKIDWSEPAAVIERKVRAYEGWPGTWFVLPNGKRLKVLSASVGAAHPGIPGTLVRDDVMGVACGDGRLLVFNRVQPEGGAPMDGVAFMRGYRE